MPETEKSGAVAVSKLTYQPPKLNEAMSYDEWKNELEFWSAMCGISAEDQGPIIMMNLPQDCKFGSGLRSSLMGNFKISDVRVSDGLKKLLCKMVKLFL